LDAVVTSCLQELAVAVVMHHDLSTCCDLLSVYWRSMHLEYCHCWVVPVEAVKVLALFGKVYPVSKYFRMMDHDHQMNKDFENYKDYRHKQVDMWIVGIVASEVDSLRQLFQLGNFFLVQLN
jgi:hypothetical protein